MFEFLKSNLDYIFKIIAELILAIFKPRLYLKIISNEPLSENVKRVSFLTILYLIIGVSLISIFAPDHLDNNYLQLIGIGFIEILLGMYYLFPLLIAKFLFETKVSSRQIIVFILTLKYAIFPFIILTYLLFLATENYTFTLYRAFFVWIYFSFSLIILPIISTAKLSRRVFSIFTSLISAIIIAILIGFTFKPFKIDNSSFEFKKFLALYDPIGNESISIIKKLDECGSSRALYEYALKYTESVNLRREQDTLYIYSIRQTKLDSLFHEWEINSKYYKKNILCIRKLIDSSKTNLHFRSSKNLVKLALDDLLAQELLFEELDRIYSSGRLKPYLTFLSNLAVSADKKISFMEIRNDIVINTSQLRKYLIIII